MIVSQKEKQCAFVGHYFFFKTIANFWSAIAKAHVKQHCFFKQNKKECPDHNPIKVCHTGERFQISQCHVHFKHRVGSSQTPCGVLANATRCAKIQCGHISNILEWVTTFFPSVNMSFTLSLMVTFLLFLQFCLSVVSVSSALHRLP